MEVHGNNFQETIARFTGESHNRSNFDKFCCFCEIYDPQK